MGSFRQVKMGLDDNGGSFPDADDLLFYFPWGKKPAANYFFSLVADTLYSQDSGLSIYTIGQQ